MKEVLYMTNIALGESCDHDEVVVLDLDLENIPTLTNF